MNKSVKRLLILTVGCFASLLFATTAKAACPTQPYVADGISGGSSSSLAGLIVETQNNGTRFNTSVRIWETETGGGIQRVDAPAYSVVETDSDKTWTTGGTYYISGQTTACSDTGFLFLGYGSSSAYGNKWALDCKVSSTNYFTFNISATPPANSPGGHWTREFAGTMHTGDSPATALAEGDNSTYFQASNGNTGKVIFNWIPNTAPSIIRSGPAQDAQIQIATGSTTANVNLIARSADANNDNVAIQMSYRKQNADNTWGGWYTFGTSGEASPNGPLGSSTTAIFAVGDTSANAYSTTGWQPTNALHEITYGDTTTTDTTGILTKTFTKALSAGTYEYRARSRDAHGKLSSWSSTAITFDVNAPAVVNNPSCVITPRTGLSPLVVSVTITGGTSPYDINMGDGSSVFADRTSPFYYTYSAPGSYNILVTDTAGKTCGGPVKVTDTSTGDGGEVAP